MINNRIYILSKRSSARMKQSSLINCITMSSSANTERNNVKMELKNFFIRGFVTEISLSINIKAEIYSETELVCFCIRNNLMIPIWSKFFPLGVKIISTVDLFNTVTLFVVDVIIPKWSYFHKQWR